MINLKTKYSWVKSREVLYLLLLFGYLVLNIYNNSWVKLGDVIPYFDMLTQTVETVVIPACLAVMYIVNLIVSPVDRHKQTLILQLIVFAAFAAVSVEYSELLLLGLFIICSNFASAKKIAATAAFAIVFSTTAIIVASKTGWTTDRVVSRFNGETVAHYFGFHHYAIWARQLLFAAAAYLFARGRKTTYIELIAVAVINYAVFYYSTQRLTFVTGVVMLVVFVVFVKFEIIKISNHFIAKLAAVAFPVAFIGSTALHYFYNESIGVMAKLNTLLSTRLELGKHAFELFDLKLFAQQVHGLTDYYFYIDCGYLYLLFAQGVVLTVVVMAMYSYLYKHSCKTNNTALFCWSSVSLVYLIVDNTATDLTCTAVLLLAFFSAFIEDTRRIKGQKENNL